MGEVFNVSPWARTVMETWHILWPGETPEQMLARVAWLGGMVEQKFFSADAHHAGTFSDAILELLYAKRFVPSTPILTNAWRHEKPLSACTVPPVNLRDDLLKIIPIIDTIRLEGMGTGYDFDECDKPIEVLRFLNDRSNALQDSEAQERPVGNMWVMSIYNPHIIEFINIKRWADAAGVRWIFNLSINIDEAFMHAVEHDETITLRDWRTLRAKYLFDLIAESAWECADPGLVFLDRLNVDNTTPNVGAYTTTAPCGEVWLAPGETCQFGYVNCGAFIKDWGIDYDALQKAVRLIIQYLDDALEYSLSAYSTPESIAIMSQKRKIGIGICGFADMLIALWIPYDSPEAEKTLGNMLSFINFESKKCSLDLAKKRWKFWAFDDSQYMYPHSFISRKYVPHPTDTVSTRDREVLDRNIQSTWLRNSTTLILPPTWRSSLVFDASPQIEPIFNLRADGTSQLRPDLLMYLAKHWLHPQLSSLISQWQSVQHLGSAHVQLMDLFRTSTELPISAHLNIVQTAQRYTDEAVSKTVNLPADATIADVQGIYMYAFKNWFKWVTVYRDWSKSFQPKDLK